MRLAGCSPIRTFDNLVVHVTNGKFETILGLRYRRAA
jgi:hypothetical protein